MAKVLALANKLGINVEQKEDIATNSKPVPPIGKPISVNELLEIFGKEPNFLTPEKSLFKSSAIKSTT